MRRSITLPMQKLNQARRAARHPDVSAVLARVPVARRAVPARDYWRARPVDWSRLAARSREEAADLMGMAATTIPSRMRTSIERARAWRAGRQQLRPKQIAQDVAQRAHLEELRARVAERARLDELRARVAERARLDELRARVAQRARLDELGERASSVLRRERASQSRSRRALPWLFAAVAAVAGAAAMFYADPSSGRRRRALVKDKAAHVKRLLTRNVPRAAERRGRFLRGKLVGVRHEVEELAAVGVQRATPDNETLVARVRSEVLGHTNVKPGEIHIDAYEGCVTLRGEIGSESTIRALVEATRHVGGVDEVRSYLHLPGTLPPNKAESFASAENGAVPAHLTR